MKNMGLFRRVLTAQLLLSLICCNYSYGDIYRWLDEHGKVHYSDKPPVDRRASIIDEQALASRFSSYTQVAVKELPFEQSIKVKNNKLVIYTTSNCGYCAKARKYFAEQKIPYQEKNITTSKTYRREFEQFGGKGVPVLFWGKYKMTGFSAERFKKMYANSK